MSISEDLVIGFEEFLVHLLPSDLVACSSVESEEYESTVAFDFRRRALRALLLFCLVVDLGIDSLFSAKAVFISLID